MNTLDEHLDMVTVQEGYEKYGFEGTKWDSLKKMREEIDLGEIKVPAADWDHLIPEDVAFAESRKRELLRIKSS